MGWASEAFQYELARAGIYPVNDRYGGERETEFSEEVKKKYKKDKETKNKLHFYNYDFPTDAQVRALRFITMQTGLIFAGNTKQEARTFISEYIDYARECFNEKD